MDQFARRCVCCGKDQSEEKKLDPMGCIVHDEGVVLTVHIKCWAELSGRQKSQLYSVPLRRTA